MTRTIVEIWEHGPLYIWQYSNGEYDFSSSKYYGNIEDLRRSHDNKPHTNVRTTLDSIEATIKLAYRYGHDIPLNTTTKSIWKLQQGCDQQVCHFSRFTAIAKE
jgi:hypothetical protein